MSVFFSQESQDCVQEMPLPMRKRRALRSLSHEPVKRTKKNEPDSLLPLEQTTPMSPDPASRATRSITPHHYQPHPQPRPQQMSSSVDASTNDVHPTILDYASPVLLTQQEGVASTKDNIESCTNEQVQLSNVAIGTTPAEKTSPSVEEDNIDRSTEGHKEGENLCKEEKGSMCIETEAQKISSSSQEEPVETSTPSSEVASPRRYGTRRQGKSQGNIVEKLTQNYSARIEQALGSPEVKKRQLSSPRRTSKAKITPKSGARPVGRPSRKSRGAQVKGQGDGDMEKAERDDSANKGADLQAKTSEASCSQTGSGKQGMLTIPYHIRV